MILSLKIKCCTGHCDAFYHGTRNFVNRVTMSLLVCSRNVQYPLGCVQVLGTSLVLLTSKQYVALTELLSLAAPLSDFPAVKLLQVIHTFLAISQLLGHTYGLT